MKLRDWQKEHYTVISDFLRYLNITTSDFVLKGETSLIMRCKPHQIFIQY